MGIWEHGNSTPKNWNNWIRSFSTHNRIPKIFWNDVWYVCERSPWYECTIRDTKNHRFDDDEPLLGSWPFVQVAYFLLKNGFKGSEVNEAKGLWWTYPLHVAVKQNNPYVTSKLLFFGADPTTTDIWGQTAYGLAKRQRKTQMVKIFESQRNRAVWGTAINSNTSRYY